MRTRHFHVFRRGDVTRIRDARGEVAIRASDLPDLIEELKAIDAEIDPRPAFARDAAMRDDALTGEG
jgi:hypothetical protein